MKKSYYLLGYLFFCGSAFASSCNELNIFLVNKTHSKCKITKVAYNGELMKWDMDYINIDNTVQAAVLEQRPFHGPDMALDISCGSDQIIRLYSKQNYCFLSEGNITGRIESTNNMHAAYSAKVGSYSGNQSGSITWTLTNN